MSKLSVLYVTRNEADLLERSLNSIQPIADEIVIIDTGSMDKTLQICRKFRYIRIFGHAWMHDFSQTKNYGIRQCTGDWILNLDGDELLDPSSAIAIKMAIENAKSNVAAFGLNIIDHETALDFRAPANKIAFFGSPQIRLFRKHRQIKFEGKVCESIAKSAKEIGGIDILESSIHHFLWRGKGQSYKEGRLRYYAQLGAILKEPVQPPAVKTIKDNTKVSIPVQTVESTSVVSVPATQTIPEVAAAENTSVVSVPAIQTIESTPVVSVPAIQTAIIVCAHNALATTKECVSYIARNTSNPHILQLVDNGSTDGTLEYMKGVSSNLAIPSNRGIAHGRNLGAYKFLNDPSIKYLCFLDNDTKVSDGWLSSMISIMEANPKIGILGPLSNNADGSQNIYEMPNSEKHLSSREPEFFFADDINRFCMLVPVAIAKGVGLFDETFGLYGCEEKDLCIRVKEAGYEVAIANRVYIEHAGKTTILQNKMDWQKLMSYSTSKFMKKWKHRPLNLGPHSPNIKRAIAKQPYPRLSFIILTHNRLDMTKDCINSILSTCRDFELVIVDNASTDNTPAWIRSVVPNAIIIQNDKNLGVPKARNQGVKASSGRYLVVMDNDILLYNGWLDELFREIKNGADMVGIEGWQLDHNHSASYKCQATHERFDYLGGALNIIKREVFETAGLYDEGFSPAYYEDCLFSIHAKQSGFKLTWVPTSKVYHRANSTLVHGQKDFNYQEVLATSHRRFAAIMRGEIRVKYEKLPKEERKPKILYSAMYYDYGLKERGMSFEQTNFCPSLQMWPHTKEMVQFDFVQLGQQYGINRMSDMLYEAVLQHSPDAIFIVPFDEAHDPKKSIFDKIRKNTSTKSIFWFCDSHFRYENFDRLWADHADFCVTTSSGALEKYKRDGLGHKVIKSQWAAAPTYNYDTSLPLDVQVSFIGQPHGDRRQVIDTLRRAGIDVQVYGTGWGQRISHQQMVSMFTRSRINLSLNNACDARFQQIKGRNFEVPACGGFLLTGAAEDLNDYYQYGKEVAAYGSTAELIDKIRHYLANEKERAAIAKAGYERTMREHTYNHRFDKIFKQAGLI